MKQKKTNILILNISFLLLFAVVVIIGVFFKQSGGQDTEFIFLGIYYIGILLVTVFLVALLFFRSFLKAHFISFIFYILIGTPLTYLYITVNMQLHKNNRTIAIIANYPSVSPIEYKKDIKIIEDTLKGTPLFLKSFYSITTPVFTLTQLFTIRNTQNTYACS
jgi:hypothetical protein